MMKALLLGGVAAFGFTGAAQADVIFSLPSTGLVTLGSALVGTLTGSFTTNDTLTAVTTYDITASAGGAFTGFRYTTANSSVTASLLPSSLIQIDTPGPNGRFSLVRLFFSERITTSGASISASFSSEHEPSGGDRYLASNIVAVATSVTTVPEPASLALLGMGVAGVAAMRLRRAV